LIQLIRLRWRSIGGVIAVEQGASFLILWNVLARVAIVALSLSGGFSVGKRLREKSSGR
jgi:hypothetical protein